MKKILCRVIIAAVAYFAVLCALILAGTRISKQRFDLTNVIITFILSYPFFVAANYGALVWKKIKPRKHD